MPNIFIINNTSHMLSPQAQLIIKPSLISKKESINQN